MFANKNMDENLPTNIWARVRQQNIWTSILQIQYMLGEHSPYTIYERDFASQIYGLAFADKIYGRAFARYNIWARIRQQNVWARVLHQNLGAGVRRRNIWASSLAKCMGEHLPNTK